MAMGVLLIILGGIFVTGIFIYFANWASDCEDVEADLKLSYKSFKSFYNMNPDAWKLKPWMPMYVMYTGETLIVKFNVIDTVKYNFFNISQEFNKKDRASRQAYAKLINSVKHDIANYENKSKTELDKMIEEIYKNEQNN